MKLKYRCREDLYDTITFEGVLVAFVKIVVAIEFYQIMPAVENRLSATIQLKNMTTYFDRIVQFLIPAKVVEAISYSSL